MTVQKITSYEQFKEAINGDKPVVIDFSATWCGPCKIISPIFHRFSELPDLAEYVDFYEVDVDEQGEVAQEARITAMPTFLAYSKGQPSPQVQGANPRALDNLIRTYASAAASTKNAPVNVQTQQQTVVA